MGLEERGEWVAEGLYKKGNGKAEEVHKRKVKLVNM
jgi:hypothetical protein